jgi:hypothetical protein
VLRVDGTKVGVAAPRGAALHALQERFERVGILLATEESVPFGCDARGGPREDRHAPRPEVEHLRPPGGACRVGEGGLNLLQQLFERRLGGGCFGSSADVSREARKDVGEGVGRGYVTGLLRPRGKRLAPAREEPVQAGAGQLGGPGQQIGGRLPSLFIIVVCRGTYAECPGELRSSPWAENHFAQATEPVRDRFCLRHLRPLPTSLRTRHRPSQMRTLFC